MERVGLVEVWRGRKTEENGGSLERNEGVNGCIFFFSEKKGFLEKEKTEQKNRVRIGGLVSWDSGFWEILRAWGRVRENWEEEFESHGEAVSKRSYREVISSWAEEELVVLVQVFSMLDTQSLCYTAATCSMFHKCVI